MCTSGLCEYVTIWYLVCKRVHIYKCIQNIEGQEKAVSEGVISAASA